MWFSDASYAASSVYIPGLPSTSSSSIGITCQANFPGTGCTYCNNVSPGPVISSAGVVSSGYQNRLMFVTPGSYSWNVPANTTTMKLVVIGAGGAGGGGISVTYCASYETVAGGGGGGGG